MPTYVVPHAEIEQEFTQNPVFAQRPLSAFIIGPQYKLCRYSQASEKANTKVINPSTPALQNQYQPGSDVVYNYPGKPTGAVVDQNYVKVFMENERAQYFPNSDLGSASDAVAKVAIPGSAPTAYYANRVRSSSLIFKTANGYSRSSVFSNRDVQAGDFVEITDGGVNTLLSRITGLVADVAASSIGTVAKADANAPTQSRKLDYAVTWAGGGGEPINFSHANTSTEYLAYLELGVVSDTYTMTVTTGGNLAAVRFTVTSANNVFAPKTNVALDTNVLTLDDEGSNSVTVDWTGTTATFVEGQVWTLKVDAAVVNNKPTAAGTYTGTVDTSYIVTITRGGPFYDGGNAATCARATITSLDVDSSGPVNVAVSSAFAVGNYGVTATFSTATANGGLVLGDAYYIPVTASKAAQTRTLVFQDSLTSALLAAGSLTIKLHLFKATEQISEIRSLVGGTVNWVTSSTGITIKSGIVTHDANLVSGVDEVDLDVKDGYLYVEHRDLLMDNTLAITSVNSTQDIVTKLGTIDPDNPIAQGAYMAVLNANDITVYCLAVASDDLAGYNAALTIAKHSDDVYSCVPMTDTKTIVDAVVAHVDAMSTPVEAKWRICWASFPLVPSRVMYGQKPDESNWTAIVSQDPEVLSTSYSLVTISGATLITDGVRAGDVLKINFRTDPAGNIIYDQYTIGEVRTETTCVLTTALPAAVVVAIKVEIDRVYTSDEQITNLAAINGSYVNRRVRIVFPDTVKAGSTVLKGYFVAAALAGLRSGVVPHAGLTNTQVLGFDDVTKSVVTFNEDQLNTLAAAGTWIVTQSVIGATPYVRHQLTTDPSSVNMREDSITTNVDSMSYGMQQVLNPFIGIYNRNTETMTLIKNAVDKQLLFYQTNTYTQRTGNQLIGYDQLTVTANPTFADKVDVSVRLQVPAPINYIYLTFLV